MKKFKIAILCLMLLSFVIAGVSIPFLNDTIPTHFGVDGTPDQYGSKYFVVVFAIVAAAVGASMILVAQYGKVSDNYKKYLLLTGVVVEILFLTMMVVFVLCGILYNDNTISFDVSKLLMPIMGLMFIVIGNFTPKIEKNRTLGMKTKWAKYNEITWQKTQRFTGFAAVVCGVLCLLLGMFFKEEVNFIILMVLVLVMVISSTIASYIYYKEEKAKEVM